LLKLNVIICSTRPGRVGPSVARWFHGYAKSHGKFDAELVDLADFKLPVYDEPKHPRLKDYQHEHTKKWSASVAAADAFAFVAPEYNYSPTPALVNALDFVFHEWAHKPAGIVSYGGISAGLRAAQSVKLHICALNMMPIPAGVPIPAVGTLIDKESGAFKTNDLIDASAKTMLDQLLHWAEALKPMRG
jgi:NAD(P)H-dependent FMN reductase